MASFSKFLIYYPFYLMIHTKKTNSECLGLPGLNFDYVVCDMKTSEINNVLCKDCPGLARSLFLAIFTYDIY